MSLRKRLVKHVVDTTAIVSVMNPAFAFVETKVVGMSQSASLDAKLLGTTIGYLGMGSVYSCGRRAWHRFFEVSSEKKAQNFHDRAYAIAYHSVFIPALYLACGNHDWKQIGIGTLLACGTVAATGGIVGRSIDTFQRLTGTGEKATLEDTVLPRYDLAAKIAATSVGLTSLFYL